MQITTFLLIALASSGLAEPLPFTKLREGKCTAPGGDCRVRVKGFPTHKSCEMGSECSSSGSPCFLKGRSWTSYHVSCT